MKKTALIFQKYTGELSELRDIVDFLSKEYACTTALNIGDLGSKRAYSLSDYDVIIASGIHNNIQLMINEARRKELSLILYNTRSRHVIEQVKNRKNVYMTGFIPESREIEKFLIYRQKALL